MVASGELETGAARRDELESVVRILSEAFALPYASARRAFIRDPFFRLENKRVLRREGHVVSCLNLVERTCRIGDAEVGLFGIAGVATRADARGRGYASRLLVDSLREVAARGSGFVGLTPSAPAFYRRLGWETASTAYRFRAPITVVRRPSHEYRVRPPGSRDIPGIQGIHEAFSPSHTLSCRRDVLRWRTLLGQAQGKLVALAPSGAVTAYVVYDLVPGRIMRLAPCVASAPVIRILELAGYRLEAIRGLLNRLGARSRADTIEFAATRADLQAFRLAATGAVLGRQPHSADDMEAEPGIMLRLADPTLAIRGLVPNWPRFAGAVGLRMNDLALGSDKIVVVEGGTDGTCRVFEDPERAKDVVEGDVAIWSRVAVGHLSAGEALDHRLLRAGSPQAASLVAEMFPAREPHLSPLDSF